MYWRFIYFLKKLITPAYATSLALAILLWSLTKFSGTFTENFNINIHLNNIPQQYILKDQAYKPIQIKVRASGFRLLLLKLSSYADHEIDFKDLKETNNNKFIWLIPTTNTSLFPDYINNIAITWMSQSEISFKIHSKIKREVKIIPNFQTEQGILVDSFLLNPSTIEVFFNDSSEITNSISTDLIRIGEKDKSFELQWPDKKSWEWKDGLEPQISTWIQCDKFTEKDFEIPIKHPNQAIKLFPNKIHIKTSIPTKKFEKVTNSDFLFELLPVDTHLATNSLQVDLVKYPDFVKILNFEPKEIEYLEFKNDDE
jgi:hypothetical protein